MGRVSWCLAPLAFVLGACSQGPSRTTPPLSSPVVAATTEPANIDTHGTIADDAIPPVAPPAISVVSGAQERNGVLLAFDWLGPQGSHLVQSPDRGGRVTWIPIAVGPDGLVEFRIRIAVPAVRLDLRTISADLGPTGVPEGEPALVLCHRDAASPSGCSWRVVGGSTILTWAPSAGVRHVVVSGVWHIPASAQTPQGPVDDSASWGFSLCGSQ